MYNIDSTNGRPAIKYLLLTSLIGITGIVGLGIQNMYLSSQLQNKTQPVPDYITNIVQRLEVINRNQHMMWNVLTNKANP